MEKIVIACYRPKPGQLAALEDLVRQHVPLLKSRQLVTERQPIIMLSASNEIVEVFEWRSAYAIEAAHQDSEVQKLWNSFAQICDYCPIAEISEAKTPFSEMTPMN